MKLINSKKIINIMVAIAVSSILFSCNSTKNVSSGEVDEYADTVEDSERTKLSGKTSASNENKQGFNWASFWGGDKFTEIKPCEFYTTTITYSLKKQDAVVFINNKAKTAGFASPYMASYYYVSFDEAGRAKFRNAVNQYLKEFEDKKLDRDSKTSYKAYGFSNMRLDWGSFKSSVPNYGGGDIFFGYKFKDKSPYFTVSAFPVANQKKLDGDETAILESMQLSYYFTKAQATYLAEALSEENLAEFLADKFSEEFSTADDY